jgi:hypothetical protein
LPLSRLEEIETDLLARQSRARAEGWLGELEGIDLTLTFLRDKRKEAERVRHHGPITLGMPTSTRAAERP